MFLPHHPETLAALLRGNKASKQVSFSSLVVHMATNPLPLSVGQILAYQLGCSASTTGSAYFEKEEFGVV